jgi:glycosyltransferase involved in cell wall biosynthesis
LREDIVERPGVDADKVFIIPNAVNIEQFQLSTKRDARLEMEHELAGAFVLGFLGSYYAYEGLDLLLTAVPGLLGRIPNLKILLVGGGPEEERLKQRARDLGIDGKVIFVGRVPQKQVPAYASLIDLMVFPRYPMRLTETVTPLKPLEAMAQGKLVLASDVGGHLELIHEGNTGWLFAAGNAGDLVTKVLQIVADKTAQETVRANGRRFVEEERNWTRSVARYEAVYDKAKFNKARS